MKVWVLLFGPAAAVQGIYTVVANHRNTVLAFEAEDDAIRYAGLLEAQDFFQPVPEAIDERELKEFCEDAGYGCEIVSAGQLVIPPEINVQDLDWHPDDPKGTTSDDGFDRDEIERMRHLLEGLL